MFTCNLQIGLREFPNLWHQQNGFDKIATSSKSRRPLDCRCQQTAEQTGVGPSSTKDLHWLPVRERLEFKALTHVHKCIHNSDQSPLYLHQLIHFYIPGHSGLRSNQDKTLLQQPKAKTRAGENTFTYFGPKLWNQLPVSLRSTPSLSSFKAGLKTHLFKRAFAYV